MNSRPASSTKPGLKHREILSRKTRERKREMEMKREGDRDRDTIIILLEDGRYIYRVSVWTIISRNCLQDSAFWMAQSLPGTILKPPLPFMSRLPHLSLYPSSLGQSFAITSIPWVSDSVSGPVLSSETQAETRGQVIGQMWGLPQGFKIHSSDVYMIL